MNKKTKKRTLSMALAAALAFSPVQALAASSDIAGHWAEDVITQWENAGMISGYEDGTFRPNNSVTRAEFVIMMNNALGLTETGEVSFSDVQPGNWFYNAVAVAVAAGYCSGYEDGTFKPSATITRAEAAVMIANAAGLTQDATGAAAFTDSIPAWAQGSVGAVVNAGFMSGYPDGTFAANQSITRAEAVSSLNRVIGGVTANDVVVTEATEIADQTIDGNLIIDAALTDGKVSVKNTTVKGNIVVRGGSADALTLDGVTLEGKLIVEKEGAEVVLTGETKVPSVEISALSTLSKNNFTGSVGTITITKNLDTDKTVKLSVPADKLVLDGTAAVDVNDDITTVEVTTNAEGSKLYVNSGATVDTVVADAKASVSGTGTVKVLQANANGITVGSSLKVNKTEVAEGVDKPTTSTGGSGGGGGGSSSSADDDDTIVTPTFVVDGTTGKTWADAVAAANVTEAANYKILVRDTAAITTTGSETITFKGKGALTIQFENGTAFDASQSLTINANDAVRIDLLDAGAGAAGVTLDTLTVNAPKATVNNNFVATTTNITAVSDSTFNVKDTATTINVAKGTVNVTGAGADVVVNVTGTGPVTIKGTVKDVDLAGTGGAGSDVTLAGTVTGTISDTNTAGTVTVAEGADLPALTANTGVTYSLQGGKIGTLTADAENVTVAGTTVGTATVSTGTLTVNSGSVGTATVSDAGTVDGTGKVGTVDVTAATGATVSTASVDTVKLGTAVTAATINSTTVGKIEANNSAAATLTLGATTQVGALNATGDVTLADANGSFGVISVADGVTVDLKDAAQVSSVTTTGTGTVTVAGGDLTGVPVTAVSAVALKTAPTKTAYYLDETMDLSGMVLSVTQTVTDAEGVAGEPTTVDVNYADAAALITVDGTFNTADRGNDKKIKLKYSGLTIKGTDGATDYEYVYSVSLSPAQWQTTIVEALATLNDRGINMGSTFTEGAADVKKDAEITLPGYINAASNEFDQAVVAWESSAPDYVAITASGSDFKATVAKADRDAAKTVTLTATLTDTVDQTLTTTATYTLNIEAVNKAAMDQWAQVEATLTDKTTVTVDTGSVSLSDAEQVKGAIQSYVDTTASSALGGYTLTVEKAVKADGDNWTATLKLTGTSGADDYYTKDMTFTVVDQAAGAKAELAKLSGLTTISLPSGTIAGGSMEDNVDAAIKAEATKLIDSENYEVTVAKTSCDEAEGTVTWKGKITVTSTGADSATNTAADAEDRTITATEGMDVALTGTNITGTTNQISGTPDVTLTAGNTTFTGVETGTDVTSWFKAPDLAAAGLKATVKEVKQTTVENDTVVITIAMAGTTCSPVAETALNVEVPAANLTDATAALVATGNVTIKIDAVQEVITKAVKASSANNVVTITLSGGGKFNSATATTVSNYKWNSTPLASSTATLNDPDNNVLTIALADGEKVNANVATDISFELAATVFDSTTIVTEDMVTVEYSTQAVATAAISDLTVNGTVGSELGGTDIATITLTDDTVKGEIAADQDVSTWFTGLPAGVVAQVSEKVDAGANTIKVKFTGTPTEASSAAFNITIPADQLNLNKAVTVTSNANAKFNIAGTATVDDVTISGTASSALSGSDTVTITLKGDKIKTQIDAEDDLSGWFTGLPDGVKAQANAQVDVDATTIVVKFTGTPSAESSAALDITVPADQLASGIAIDVTANSNAKFEIASA